MGRRTGQLPPSTPTLDSFFDYVDPNETDPTLKDKTTTIQHIVELVIEVLGDPGGVTGLTYDHDIPAVFANGKSLGKWVNGDTVDSTGKTPYQVLEEAFADYLAPAVTAMTAATLIKTFEVGEDLPDGNTSVSYTVSNPTNIKTQPPAIGLVSTNIPDASFPTNPVTLLGSGGFVIDIEPDTRFAAPGNLTITLQGTNSNDDTFSGIATIKGRYYIFYGPTSAVPTDSAGVRALPTSRFDAKTSLGDAADNTFILNTGNTEKVFSIALPASKTLVSVFDLDALNAPLTTQYQAGLATFNVNDANGVPVSYKVYSLSNDAAYATSHRHSITISGT